GLGMGLGFTMSISLLSAFRELIGNGTLLGMQVMPASYQPMAMALKPPGGFIMLGILLLLINAITKSVGKKKLAKAKEVES
ncbi:MAG TPA: Rnf-Nqr domain containing protein, partial [Candidatus Limiplasma sp.]|nr:Rnf-Nqr domain containing protein [Candidatus Limiplasma sp.]